MSIKSGRGRRAYSEGRPPRWQGGRARCAIPPTIAASGGEGIQVGRLSRPPIQGRDHESDAHGGVGARAVRPRMIERWPLNQLHRVEMRAILFTGCADGYDIRAVQLRRGFGLTAKSLNRPARYSKGAKNARRRVIQRTPVVGESASTLRRIRAVTGSSAWDVEDLWTGSVVASMVYVAI